MRSLKDHSTVRITLCVQSGVYPDPFDILISIQMDGITPLNHPLCKQDGFDSRVKIQSRVAGRNTSRHPSLGSWIPGQARDDTEGGGWFG